MNGKFNYTLTKEIMKQKGITQQELAHMLFDFGVETQIDAVKSWFRKNDKTRNTPKLSTVQAIAKILGVTIDELVNDKQNNTNQNIKENAIFNYNNLNINKKIQSKTMNKFLNLFTEYGNDKMLLPIIEKLEKMKKIAES